MYDFVVVGAGPAGSRFARSASQGGRDVLVLESGEVGRPLACSGHVSLDVWEFVPDDARPELFQNDIYGARFHLGGGADQREAPEGRAGGAERRHASREADRREASERASGRSERRERRHASQDGYAFYKNQPVSNAIDRVGLDETLAECAADAGAEVRDGHTVTRVEEGSGGVTVTARGPDGTETFGGRIVVGADGPRSKVREAVGLPEPDELLHGVLGFDDAPDHRDHVDVHLTVPRFFAWRIPRGDAGVEYGLAVAPGDDAPSRFDALLSDAAAQTKPFTGGGILYGMRAADVAAREVDPRQPATLDDYEQAWRAELRRDQRLGHLIRAGYSMPRPVQKAGLRAFSGEIGVHMDRPTSVFSKAQLRALLSWG
ncbi:electron transfer flavoprotein [Halobacteriales archaeon QH_7_69_31]|nr:MAG: electron transfer flavoprotein [Halobacteriales archaeon QH_7_69_31]